MKEAILLNVDAETLARWDKWARALHLSRTEFIRRAVNCYCNGAPDSELWEQLRQVLDRLALPPPKVD